MRAKGCSMFLLYHIHSGPTSYRMHKHIYVTVYKWIWILYSDPVIVLISTNNRLVHVYSSLLMVVVVVVGVMLCILYKHSHTSVVLYSSSSSSLCLSLHQSVYGFGYILCNKSTRAFDVLHFQLHFTNTDGWTDGFLIYVLIAQTLCSHRFIPWDGNEIYQESQTSFVNTFHIKFIALCICWNDE